MFPSLSLVASVILALHVSCSSANWWMERPYGDDSFLTKIDYLQDITLNCTDDRNETRGYVPSYWILPNLQIMYPKQSESFITLDGISSWTVNDDASSISIVMVQEEHFGFYHCVLENNSQYQVVKKAINYKGPYFGDLWGKYRMNVIIACSAAAGMLVLSTALCCIHAYFYPYVDDEEDDELQTKEENAPAVNGGAANKVHPGSTDDNVRYRGNNAYDNNAYEMVEVDVATKM